MDLHLSGKTALVTGASKGIGLAIVRALVAEGITVVAGARTTTPELAALADAGRVHPVNVDLGTPDGPGTLVEAGTAVLGGRLDILVNNVGGVRPRVGGFLSVTDDDWLETLTINFLAAVRTTRAALPALVESGGSIVTVNSVNSSLPDPLVIDYSAAKAALANFSKSLSKEVGPRGVRVNTISPGPVETDLWLGAGGVAETVGGANNLLPAEVARGAVSGTATGRFTRPEEVADLVLLLAGGRARNVTGADIVIDGGLIPTI
ncbi:SDR family oxidoreductase [Micromonospora sp. NBC_01796]|uniref:SDR family oxidoreductase n=1 Tax=Micromonospora sp. NBC_01796 TaxID=2975987 RepID=UPI002DDBBC41|nr:SDR family oxidoreductase [Micromonospora sp. NBC_01796]WSA83707.1 SDR family oxidoreductase [Micromonospora sp. NBC_01796]